MKKISLILSLALALVLTGCGDKAETPEPAPAPDTVMEETTTPPAENTEPAAVETEVEAAATTDQEADTVTTYMLDTEASTFGWVGKKVTGEHSGVVSLTEGKLDVDGDMVKGGMFSVDLTTITTTDIEGPQAKSLDDHLKNEDFFNVAQFPTATFMLTEATMKGDGVYTVKGNLAMRGIMNPIEFDATMTPEGDSFTAKADFEIDRTKWDLIYGSGSFFKNLGDRMINDMFGVSLDLTFTK